MDIHNEIVEGEFQWKRAIVLQFVGCCNFNVVYDKKVYIGGSISSDTITHDLEKYFSNDGTKVFFDEFCILEHFAKLVFERRTGQWSHHTSHDIKQIVQESNFQLQLHSKFQKRHDLNNTTKKRRRLDFQYTKDIIDKYLEGFMDDPSLSPFLENENIHKVFVSNTLPKAMFEVFDLDINLKKKIIKHPNSSDQYTVVDRINYYPVHTLYNRPIVIKYLNDIENFQSDDSNKPYIVSQETYIKKIWGEYNEASKEYKMTDYCNLKGEYFVWKLQHKEEFEKKTSLKFLHGMVDRLVYQIAQLKAKYYFFA